MVSAPFSVVNTTIVLSAAHVLELFQHIADALIHLLHPASSRPGPAAGLADHGPVLSFRRRQWMRAGCPQTKKGLPVVSDRCDR